MKFLAVCLILFQLWTSTYATPSGAGISSCNTLIPDHGFQAQRTEGLFSVQVSATQYTPNAELLVTLVGTRSFKGFLVIATNSTDDSVTPAIGVMSPVNATITRSMCSNKAVTHSLPLQSTNKVIVKWTAPSQLSGNIKFYASFVQSYDTYWVKVASPLVWDGKSPRVITPTTTPKSQIGRPLTPPISMLECGTSKSCWKSCQTGSQCDFLVAWNKTGTDYTFEVFAVVDQDSYAALGFSPSSGMQNVSIVACTPDGLKYYYATKEAVLDPVLEGPITNQQYFFNATESTMSCRFTYKNSVAKTMTTKWKDLDTKPRLQLARGPYTGGKISKHGKPPAVTDAVDFSNPAALMGVAAHPLIKAHGALMIIAWVLCGSIGIILARYYKPMWPQSKACGQKIWFQMHRALMLAAMFICLIAFVLILIKNGGVYRLPEKLPWKAHPIIGLIAIICSILNPLIAAFRCQPSDKKRPIFNWLHWFFGTVGHVFATVAVFLGLLFEAAQVPPWITYVMMAYCLVHVLTELILEIQTCCMYDKNRDRQELFELTKQDVGKATEPYYAGRGFRCAVFVIYAILVTIIALVLAFIVAFWNNSL